MENKFKVGDRVEFISNDGYQLHLGDFPGGIKGNYGTVASYMHGDKYKVLVDGQIRDTPWTFFAKSFKLINNNLKSTIGKSLKNYGTTKSYRNEVMTHLEDATFYQDDKLTFLKTDKGTGYALRNPEDANDTEKGIYLAVTRIFGETKPKWQIGVDECVKTGKTVEIKIKSESMQKEVEAYYIYLGGSYYCEESKNKAQVGKYLCLDNDLDILLNEGSRKDNASI